jgi:GTPase SAR1 family protein
MGGIGSKFDSQQILLVGLEKSGKSLFLKRLLELKKEPEKANLESTNGYNYVNFQYNNIALDIWDLGGDFISRSYWPTFYRNIQFTIVIFIININDESTHMTALKELLILINQEEVKQAKFFIIFNTIMDDNLKMAVNEAEKKEYREKAEELMLILRECPIHDYDARVYWDIIDIMRMKDGENKTTELLKKCFMGNKEGKNE